MIAGKNLLISGGTFNHTVSRTALSTCFDKLAQKASPLSFHLADSDLSHSTCFANTRTKILERLKGWALRDIEKDKFVMWLHGPAGGGKTAIGRSIAKWCEDEGILLGEFFFSRANGIGAQLASLAPTLAYRMAVHTLQDAKELISDVINHDPHIFLAPLAIQLKKLVMEPLNLLAPCGIVPYVIILDGLDETLSSNDQQLVLNVISETLYQLNPTLRILICCRPEPTIVTAFNDPYSPLNSISAIISLNDDVDADADIRTFLVEKFARTKKQLQHPPNGDWPRTEDIDYLVTKSSGQFIFAATVERYVCSPKHRHQAVGQLKDVLDLNLENKKKHPFADLDALYRLILRTRNDVNMSVNATAVCLEYPKYFITVSPADLSKVLNIEVSETRAILYELASLFDISEEGIRPFHASFGDFLFDSSRSAEFFRNGGDIAADITCAMLRLGRDPEVLSYRAFSRLLAEATPRQDLSDTLSQMEPHSIFKRPASTRRYKQRSKGAYYLISLLRQLENHVSPDAYKILVTYFDQQFKVFLPFGYWSSTIFKIKEGVDIDDDSMSTIHSGSDTSEDDSESDSEDSEHVRWRENPRESRLLTYRVSNLMPLITSPAWDEINASLNIRLTGPDSLLSLCDEARFARSHLKMTMSALLKGSKQARAALFCLKEIQSVHITKDLQIAFAKLLTHSLFHAEQLPELRTAIQQLRTQRIIYQRLPVETQKAMTEYLPSTRGSRTAARTVSNVSSTHPLSLDAIMNSSTQAMSQKPFATLNSSISPRTDQSLSPTTTHPIFYHHQLPTFFPPHNMPPRDGDPFENQDFRDSVEGYYCDGDVHFISNPLGPTSPRYSSFIAESDNFYTGYGMSAGRAANTTMNPKKIRRKWIIIVVAAAAAIIGVVVGIVVSKNKSNLSANFGSSNSSSSNSSNSTSSPNPNDPSNFPKNSAFHQSFYGIAYTPANSQLHNCGNSLAAVIRDIQIMSQLTKRIRLYGADCNQSALVLEAIVQTKVNMTVFLANYPIATDNGMAYYRQRNEIKRALKTYPKDLVAGIIVGNEFMLNYLGDNNISDLDINGDAANKGAAMLVTFIQDTISMLQKMNLSSIPVGNSDAGSYFNNKVLAAVNFGMASAYPWFANVSATGAAAWTTENFANKSVDVANKIPNDPKMYIAETGWPTSSLTRAAESNGPSSASVHNLQIFLDTFVCQANANCIKYFFFEFSDEEWKEKALGGVQGYWGLFNQNLTLKHNLTLPNCASAGSL